MKAYDKEDFWITSDLHLGHKLVSGLRGFDDINAHDEAIMNNLMAIPDESTLIVLGDISVRKDHYALEVMHNIKKEKNLTMILTPGNHDECHPMMGLEKQMTFLPIYQEVFDIVTESFMINNNNTVMFTHLPGYEEKYMKDRLKRWQPATEYVDCIVHGHTHSDVRILPKHVNVSMEATDLKPIHSSELWDNVREAIRMK